MSDCEWEKLSLRRLDETLGVADLAHNLLTYMPLETKVCGFFRLPTGHVKICPVNNV